MGIEVEVHRAKICMKGCSWKCYAFVLHVVLINM